eukprot:TRINITY_DN2771_c0_g1_i1.p1 TRINITY_DN2771_c0_g1~~TRINITY_DN2771_c0_g1_i1.p1  ORF type:complete len:147 (+),score=48.65 TRINITY_DN2771_c0_g1_i1:95-535(+)
MESSELAEMQERLTELKRQNTTLNCDTEALKKAVQELELKELEVINLQKRLKETSEKSVQLEKQLNSREEELQEEKAKTELLEERMSYLNKVGDAIKSQMDAILKQKEEEKNNMQKLKELQEERDKLATNTELDRIKVFSDIYLSS